MIIHTVFSNFKYPREQVITTVNYRTLIIINVMEIVIKLQKISSKLILVLNQRSSKYTLTIKVCTVNSAPAISYSNTH